ncbi:MAG: DUF1579 family protein [Halioglobus sp.]|nr:DUF1579 family protein [Halioglobus sp.]
MKPYLPLDEHRTLARLTGDWAFEGEFYITPGHPTPAVGRLVNRGILGGHFIESSTLSEGVEVARVIYGYNAEDGQFLAFAINATTSRYDLELGQFDSEADELRFSCVEYIGPQRLAINFERTLSFLSVDAVDMRITYPDFEPDRQLGVEMRMRRI